MTNQINKVGESKTYSTYNQLMELGFNVTLSSKFQYSYNEDDSYLSISVEECEGRLTELWNAAGGLEMVLARKGGSNSCMIEVRQHRDYADFISGKVWLEYYNSL